MNTPDCINKSYNEVSDIFRGLADTFQAYRSSNGSAFPLYNISIHYPSFTVPEINSALTKVNMNTCFEY